MVPIDKTGWAEAGKRTRTLFELANVTQEKAVSDLARLQSGPLQVPTSASSLSRLWTGLRSPGRKECQILDQILLNAYQELGDQYEPGTLLNIWFRPEGQMATEQPVADDPPQSNHQQSNNPQSNNPQSNNPQSSHPQSNNLVSGTPRLAVMGIVGAVVATSIAGIALMGGLGDDPTGSTPVIPALQVIDVQPAMTGQLTDVSGLTGDDCMYGLSVLEPVILTLKAETRVTSVVIAFTGDLHDASIEIGLDGESPIEHTVDDLAAYEYQSFNVGPIDTDTISIRSNSGLCHVQINH
jgi:hypothetical protein